VAIWPIWSDDFVRLSAEGFGGSVKVRPNCRTFPKMCRRSFGPPRGLNCKSGSCQTTPSWRRPHGRRFGAQSYHFFFFLYVFPGRIPRIFSQWSVLTLFCYFWDQLFFKCHQIKVLPDTQYKDFRPKRPLLKCRMNFR
jgi:hypothetical protein